ncbi:YiiX/YebB-like N1pC/P60 family cysteine hydrolase [Nocardia vulneris]|uniref:YiiX/YebB-like N1pC/P60 family cysteine hydrolase n=1 Tax=Nocardia vulneris TaxID=1141657 RepID=UPI00068CE89B|nr:YiiX/YebB-like N1pC/P60 family cysteine hydrolase [Nocardia vulneris]
MRSDCEAIPDGFSKAQADKAETMEAAAAVRPDRRSTRETPGCQVYWPAPYEVCGAIRDKYNELGGPNSFLLFPTSNELTNPDGVGKRSTFQNGPIYWSPAGGAHPVVNHFFAAWQRNGWEGGPLGYPTSDEAVNPDGVGRRQYFQGGTIYWKLNEAYYVAGAIRDKWGETGWEGGWLGYPSTDETVLPDGQGRMNRFQSGVIYWSPSTGAHPVGGSILDKWAKAGYERSTFGYPTGDQTSRDNNVTVEQQFQGGLLTAPGPAATELAYLNPGTTGEQQIAAAQRWAQQIAAPVIDVLVEALRKAREYTQVKSPDSPSEDDYENLPDARGKGDIFYADSSPDLVVINKLVNHGHNGIYVSTTNTVEAAQGKGVHEIDNRTATNGGRRQVRKPQLGWIETSDAIRTSAVTFARAKLGKSYNNNFAWNRNVEDDQYNCSQIVWAAYMHASNGDIDMKDSFPNPTPSVYPKELFKSGWVRKYYP